MGKAYEDDNSEDKADNRGSNPGAPWGCFGTDALAACT